MLAPELKTVIQQAYSTFLETRGLKARYGQKMMIAEIARVLGGVAIDGDGNRSGEGHICVTEAGTGTGKTIAYLLASIPIAQQRKKKIVVATATVALQEQLILKDIPQLIGDTGLNFTYGLAKGRGRYFCVSGAEKALQQQNDLGQMALYEDESAQQIGADQIAELKFLLQEFASGQWDGDRDGLKTVVADAVWRLSSSDHLQCSNRRCTHFSICPFFKARQELEKWDLVVANHDLVLADLTLGGGAILPAPENAIYIFDEGHHLGSKATGHFTYSMRIKASQHWLANTSRSLNKLLAEASDDGVLVSYVEKMSTPLAEMEEALTELNQLLRDFLQDRLEQTDRYRFAQGVVPETLQLILHNFSASAERVLLKLEQIVDLLKEAMDQQVVNISQEVGERWYPQIGILLSRVQSMYWLAKSYALPDVEGKLPTARYIKRVDGSGGIDLECHSSPVSAAEILPEHLWKHCFAAVITSATLTAVGRFDRLFVDLGLPVDTVCSAHQSPFDFAAKAELQVPAMVADPSNQEAHTEEVLAYLLKSLPEQSACLTLFSSWKQMRYVLEKMPVKMCSDILVQGELAKHEILRRHRQRIDDKQPSIIFGLASFAEGVDLPGDYLTHVIITKLPFSVPDDPVAATYTEWIESQGRNAFEEWIVPMTSMRLTQATGRLLRTETDQGIITLLDRRCVTRRYGKQLLAALPPYRRNFS